MTYGRAKYGDVNMTLIMMLSIEIRDNCKSKFTTVFKRKHSAMQILFHRWVHTILTHNRVWRCQADTRNEMCRAHRTCWHVDMLTHVEAAAACCTALAAGRSWHSLVGTWIASNQISTLLLYFTTNVHLELHVGGRLPATSNYWCSSM